MFHSDKSFIANELMCLIGTVVRGGYFKPEEKEETEKVLWEAVAKLNGKTANFEKLWNNKIREKANKQKKISGGK